MVKNLIKDIAEKRRKCRSGKENTDKFSTGIHKTGMGKHRKYRRLLAGKKEGNGTCRSLYFNSGIIPGLSYFEE
jgi:hypothetical protein